VKEKFNYEIPIAEVEKAGISTTGAKIENELIDLEKDFKAYRKRNMLWESEKLDFTYEVKDNIIIRTLDDKVIDL